MTPSPLFGKKSSWDYGADTIRFIPTFSPGGTYFWVLVLELGTLSLDKGALILLCFLFATVAVVCYFCCCCCGAAGAAWLTLKLLNVGLTLAWTLGKFRCCVLLSYCLKWFYFALAFFFFFFFLDAFIFDHRGSTTRRIYFWILRAAVVSRSNRIFSKWLRFYYNFYCLTLIRVRLLT